MKFVNVKRMTLMSIMEMKDCFEKSKLKRAQEANVGTERDLDRILIRNTKCKAKFIETNHISNKPDNISPIFLLALAGRNPRIRRP